MHAGIGPGVHLNGQIAGLPGGQFHVEQFFRPGGQHADLVRRRHVLAASDGHQHNGNVFRVAIAHVGELEPVDFFLSVQHFSRPVELQDEFRLLDLDRGLRGRRPGLPTHGQIEGAVLAGNNLQRQLLVPLRVEVAELPLHGSGRLARGADLGGAAGGLGAQHLGPLGQRNEHHQFLAGRFARVRNADLVGRLFAHGDSPRPERFHVNGRSLAGNEHVVALGLVGGGIVGRSGCLFGLGGCFFDFRRRPFDGDGRFFGGHGRFFDGGGCSFRGNRRFFGGHGRFFDGLRRVVSRDGRTARRRRRRWHIRRAYHGIRRRLISLGHQGSPRRCRHFGFRLARRGGRLRCRRLRCPSARRLGLGDRLCGGIVIEG